MKETAWKGTRIWTETPVQGKTDEYFKNFEYLGAPVFIKGDLAKEESMTFVADIIIPNEHASE